MCGMGLAKNKETCECENEENEKPKDSEAEKLDRFFLFAFQIHHDRFSQNQSAGNGS